MVIPVWNFSFHVFSPGPTETINRVQLSQAVSVVILNTPTEMRSKRSIELMSGVNFVLYVSLTRKQLKLYLMTHLIIQDYRPRHGLRLALD